MSGWTTPEQIGDRARRRWSDGSLLAAYVLGEPCPRIDVPVRGPSAGEIGARLAEVQSWSAGLVRASRDGGAYDLAMRAVGGRSIGRNELPDRARITTYEQAWRLLGVASEVALVDAALTATRARLPDLVDWISRNPLKVIAIGEDWPRVLAAVEWLAPRGGRGLYLRQIEAEGVDTKFVAQHRGLIAALLDVHVPAERVASEHSRVAGFADRYGFASPPRLLRVRFDTEWAGMARSLSEVALRPDEAARLRVAVQHVVVIENEVTYLSVPVPAEGVVIWGAGHFAGRLGRLPWVRDAPRVTYWGDLDTHGFAILSMLRGQVSQVRSLLMDRETLLAHRDRWGSEPTPTRARLDDLTDEEHAVYADLVEDAYAPALRLEQERLSWTWVRDAYAAADLA